MFDQISRYYSLSVATHTVPGPDGAPVEVRYVRRRFIPSAGGETILLEHTFTEGERLDNIAASYLDDPTQFWRVCDANVVLHPEELEQVGRVIKIAVLNV
jgi:hypothetical protein